MAGDTATGLSSAGTTQATATLCPADHCVFDTVTSGQGCILKVGNASETRSVTNKSSTASLFCYPPVGAAFNGYTANIPLSIPPQWMASFRFFDANTIGTNF